MIITETRNTQFQFSPGVLVIPAPISNSIYRPTSVLPGTTFTSSMIDSTTTGSPIGQGQVPVLRTLYERSGLTWKEIAALFGVTERAVHAWLRAEKNMLPEKADFLRSLTELVLALDQGRNYKTRKFLRERILNNSTLTALLKKQDFASLLAWAESQTKGDQLHPAAWSKALSERQSPDLVTMLAGTEVEVRAVKRGTVKPVRLARARKRKP